MSCYSHRVPGRSRRVDVLTNAPSTEVCKNSSLRRRAELKRHPPVPVAACAYLPHMGRAAPHRTDAGGSAGGQKAAPNRRNRRNRRSRRRRLGRRSEGHGRREGRLWELSPCGGRGSSQQGAILAREGQCGGCGGSGSFERLLTAKCNTRARRPKEDRAADACTGTHPNVARRCSNGSGGSRTAGRM